jgi:hypothetical protein
MPGLPGRPRPHEQPSKVRSTMAATTSSRPAGILTKKPGHGGPSTVCHMSSLGHRAQRVAAIPVRGFHRVRQRTKPKRDRRRFRRAERAIFRKTRGEVADGPFKGMDFVKHAVWGTAAPLQAGCYEAEVRSAVEAIIESRPDRVVNVGAAEGYYAVGLALRLPTAVVYAYDIDPEACSVCCEVAKHNGVEDRVIVRGECTPGELVNLVGTDCALVVDCEGFEKELLDPKSVPGLASTMILVELHDFMDPSISTLIAERFRPSHEIEVFRATERDPETVPAVAELPLRTQKQVISEGRPTDPHPMEWMFLTPHSYSSTQ